MAITQQSAEQYLNQDVAVFIDGKQLIGTLISVTDQDLTLAHPRFGYTTRSLAHISGIEVRVSHD